MPDPLTQYDPPGCINDFPGDVAKHRELRRRWDQTLTGLIIAGPSFYDPKATAVGDAKRVKVEWTAFPKRSEDRGGADWFEHADVRQPPPDERQFEYCEWCVERERPGDGKIVRVTFTTEDVNYWQALWEVDPNRVLELYRQHIHPSIQLDDLRSASDSARYDPNNKWNTGPEYTPTGGGSMHMIVGINNYPAAINLVKGAAANPNDAPRSNVNRADPVVLLSVARVVVRLGLQLSFTNPVGVYLQEPSFNRFELPLSAPADLHPRDLWRVVRGRRSEGEGLRAVFEVPKEFDFVVGDVKVDGEPIRFGSQIARTLQSGTYVTPLPRS